VEGIFRLSGSARRIKELQEIFDSPERYGKGLDWTGYTVHDAANILRRYLNQLPEPIVPLDFYERFRGPLRDYQAGALGDSESKKAGAEDLVYDNAVATYQALIRELPPLNKQLLLYILDLLAVFASKSEKNRMTSANLSAIFQPGLLSHPSHDMAPEEYRLSQDVLIFLIENQDHFLFGMNGTASDPQTVKEFQSGAAAAPSRSSGVRRSASNASGGADSLRKYETLRRNVSVSSRNSRTSGNAQSPGTPSSIVGGSVKRSNTVPSKKSPALATSRLGRSGEQPATPTSAGLTPPIQRYGGASRSGSRTPPAARSPRPQGSPAPPEVRTTGATESSQAPSAEHAVDRPQLLGPLPSGQSTSSTVVTPTRDRKLTSFFAKSPPTGTEYKEGRQPNRLKKKRIPGSSNVSAQSSNQSLNAATTDTAAIPSTSQVSTPVLAQSSQAVSHPNLEGTAGGGHALEGGHHQHQPSESTLKPSRSRTPSIHSRSSYTDHSDFDQIDEGLKSDKKDNRRSWRLAFSKRTNDPSQSMSPPQVGVNSGAEFSTSSIGSSTRPRGSSANESHKLSTDITSTQDTDFGRSASNLKEGTLLAEPEKRSLFDKFKAKVAHMKDGGADRERAKSPPQSDTEWSVASSQNLSRIASEGKNGRVSTEQPRESLDAAHEAGTSHQTVTAPPVILEEPATVPSVNSPPESGGKTASSAVPLDSTLASADAKGAAPLPSAENTTSMTEAHADAANPSGKNTSESHDTAEGSGAPTITAASATNKSTPPIPEEAENS
jgi:hypothetical protein